jgi:hypothetical protein
VRYGQERVISDRNFLVVSLPDPPPVVCMISLLSIMVAYVDVLMSFVHICLSIPFVLSPFERLSLWRERSIYCLICYIASVAACTLSRSLCEFRR